MPMLASAMLPDLRKNLRFINAPLLPLKLRRAENHSDDLRGRITRVCFVDLLHQRLSRPSRDIAGDEQLQRLVDQFRLVLRGELCEIDARARNTIACECKTKVHALEQRARVYPILRGIGI